MIMASGSRAGLSSNEQKKIISQLVDVTGWDEKRSRGALEERQWNLQHVLEMDFIEGRSDGDWEDVKSKKAPSKDNTSGYVSSKSRNGGDRRGDRFRKQDGRVDNRSGKTRGGKNINMEPRDAANRSNMDASSAISKGKNAPVQKENDTAQAQQKHTQSNAATDGSNGARAAGKPAAGGGKDKEKARAKEMDNVKAKEPINANANTVSWAKLVTTGPKEVVPPKADNAESQSTTTTTAAAASSSSSNSKKDTAGNAHKSSKGESKAAVTRVETANKTVSESNAEREKAKEKETEKGKEKAGRNERKSASKPVITATDDTATGMVDTGPNSLTQGETGRPTRNRGGRKEKESEKEKKSALKFPSFQ